MLPKFKTLLIVFAIVFILLLIPLLAMQFTDEVHWTVFDFIVAGVLLFTTGLVIQFVLKKAKNTKHRILICVIILILLFLLWAELAVGIFGSAVAGN
ncbi:hypothetical protein Q361_1117 [Flavobacterium croceum DSM 17960]|uniref:Uncharacterized protein n=1 Tax=Flavobacterium croceum DSM 17960 TaxID=1121886 RepID=A0A2S4N6F7_9FLAO|nr:hypothetical protein [Flavobacterium croceum]POS01296.1 hypothetical protein Q361_1117 [Flavobacterium croceum DSM 17960]